MPEDFLPEIEDDLDPCEVGQVGCLIPTDEEDDETDE